MNIYYLAISLGQELRGGLAVWSRLRIFHEIVSPLHTNLQVVTLQRCECAFRRHQAWVKLQPAPRLLLLTVLQLHHLPLLSFLQSVTLVACSLNGSPCKPAVVLYYCIVKVLYYRVKHVFFLSCLFVYYLCKKYYKLIRAQYYILDRVSWVPT